LIQFTDLLQIRETAHKNAVELKVLEKYVIFITNIAYKAQSLGTAEEKKETDMTYSCMLFFKDF